MDPDGSLPCSQDHDCGPCSHDMILVHTLQFHFFILMHAICLPISSSWFCRGVQIMKNKKLFIQQFLFSHQLLGPSWIWIFSSEHYLSLSVIWLFSVNNVTNLCLTPIQNNILVIMFIDFTILDSRWPPAQEASETALYPWLCWEGGVT
jgi:hypothetical protein